MSDKLHFRRLKLSINGSIVPLDCPPCDAKAQDKNGCAAVPPVPQRNDALTRPSIGRRLNPVPNLFLFYRARKKLIIRKHRKHQTTRLLDKLLFFRMSGKPFLPEGF